MYGTVCDCGRRHTGFYRAFRSRGSFNYNTYYYVYLLLDLLFVLSACLFLLHTRSYFSRTANEWSYRRAADTSTASPSLVTGERGYGLLSCILFGNLCNFCCNVFFSVITVIAILGRNVTFPACEHVCKPNCTHFVYFKSATDTLSFAYDHTTLKAPVLVRSPKLSSVGPAQYLDG